MKRRSRAGAALAVALAALLVEPGCCLMRRRESLRPETVSETTSTPARQELRARVPAPGVLAANVDDVVTTVVQEKKRTVTGWRRGKYTASSAVIDLFCFDPFMSLGAGIYSIFSPDHEVTLGPVGVLIACLVPGISCVPYEYQDELEDKTTKEELGERRETVARKPRPDTLVRVQGPTGEPLEARTDASGAVKLSLGRIALAALGGGLDSALLVVTSGESRVELPLALDDLLAVADDEARVGSLPAPLGEDLPPAVAFWSTVAAQARGHSPALEEAAAERLRPFHVSTRALDAGSARLLLAGAGSEKLDDGTVVDWAPGAPVLAPRPVVDVGFAEGHGEVVSGETVSFVVTVANRGKGALYQLRCLTRSAVPAANGIQVLFGKIEPGASVTRRIDVATPRTLATDNASVELEWREKNGYAPLPVEGRFRVRQAARPAFAFSVRAVDDGTGRSVGNGDGVVQRGEAIDLRIGIKNTGDAPALDASLALEIPVLDGIQVFGERQEALGRLEPGDVREVVINISVKPTYTGAVVPVRARVVETSPFHAVLEQDCSLTIDERAPRRVIAIDRAVAVVRAASLLAAASGDARSLGRVEKGSRLRGVGELDEFVQVEYGDATGHRRAWLARRDLSFELEKAPALESGAPVGAVVREFVKAPPIVVFASPQEGKKTETGEEDVPLKATVKSEETLASVRVLVNDEPFEPRSPGARGIAGVRRLETGPEGAARGAAGPRTLTLDERVPLRPGENRIAVEATDAAGEKSRVEVTVVRATREPNVFALVVGIDHYDDVQVPALRFAEADARAVAAFLRGPRSLVKRPEDVKLLLGKEATTTAIREALEKHLIAGASHPEDMALFYFAGHGFSEGERYFLAGCDTQVASLRATAIRLQDLQDYWKDVRADRKVFVADACHSGGLRGLRGENSIHAGLLSSIEGKGKVMIAASRDKQASCESEKLGHGVFTAALLDGLSGKADQETGNRDGRVTVRELVTYLAREVPALAQKEGHEQTPNYEIGDAEGELLLTR